jgi:hypothetical protein
MDCLADASKVFVPPGRGPAANDSFRGSHDRHHRWLGRIARGATAAIWSHLQGWQADDIGAAMKKPSAERRCGTTTLTGGSAVLSSMTDRSSVMNHRFWAFSGGWAKVIVAMPT